MKTLFAELEEYDDQERAETLKFLKSALNETRASLAAEPAYGGMSRSTRSLNSAKFRRAPGKGHDHSPGRVRETGR